MVKAAYFILYIYLLFITIIWGSLNRKNFFHVIRQPMVYLKLVKFESESAILYLITPIIIFGPVSLVALLFTGVTAIVFPHVDPFTFFAFYIVLPAFVGLIFMFHSSLYVLCVVCNGKGKLHGFNDLIDISFNREVCFCCNGKGKIALNTKHGDTHRVLRQNVETMRIQEKLAQKFGKDLSRINNNISRHGDSPTLQDLKKRVEAKYNFQKESFDFYDLALRKMCTAIYEKSLHSKYEFDDTKYDQHLGDTMVASERVKDETAELAYDMSVMNEKMKMNDYSPESINDLKTEIAKIKSELEE